ncbi:MAG: Z1 domain-containing protein [Bacteroidales bacterium]|nr:Z1 domain-containing protein [Bacteroidales bacterium]
MDENIFNKLKEQAFGLFEVARQAGKPITQSDLDNVITNLTMFVAGITDNDKAELKAYLESHLFVEHDHDGYVCIDANAPNYDREWYTNWYSKLTHDPQNDEEHFWNLYKRYLIQEGSMDLDSLGKLGGQTLPKLMNCLGNPNDILTEQRVRYGLVIGDVQSGKTSTYAGLICKAADAGMKVVILLAGQTETLRQQTQERMEDDIVGYTIQVDNNRTTRTDKVGVGRLTGYSPIVTALTSYQDDFKIGHDRTMASIAGQKSIVMFVVKKNVTIMERMYNWLTSTHQQLNADGKLPYSLLLIDDEADNASINTNKDDYTPTKTNKAIRQLCEAFMNSNYVGFTATPYANIFINPESDNEMLNADLFPRDFIYVLPTPSPYIGALKMFCNPTVKNPICGSCSYMLRYITDIMEPTTEDLRNMSPDEKKSRILYFKHGKDWRGELPPSLYDALRSFYIANVLYDLGGYGTKPRTMLVNVTRFQPVQSYIKQVLKEQVQKDYDELRCNLSGNYTIDSTNNSLFKKLIALYESSSNMEYNSDMGNYSNLGYNIQDVLNKDNLLRAIESIRVIVVNGTQESKGDTPDYKTNPSQRIIAVGGLALSRGLTLRGLMISYFYRNTATYDTLMQMGRWFGYRPNYEKLCRVWITNSSADWYRDIAESTEELKKDLDRMNRQHLTPKDFGLRIRRDNTALEITARNKMGTGKPIHEMISFWGDIFETPYFSADKKLNDNNLTATKKFINDIMSNNCPFAQEGTGSTMISRNVPIDLVKTFLNMIKDSISVFNRRFNVEKIKEFIEDNESLFQNWDVALVGGEGGMCEIASGVIVRKPARTLSILNDETYAFSSRGAIGGANDGKIGVSKQKDIIESDYRQKEAESKNVRSEDISIGRETWFKYVDRNPMILIYCVTAKNKEDKMEMNLKSYIDSLNGDPIMGYAIGFPGKGHTAEEHDYYENIVARNQNDEVEDDDLE